MINGGADDHDTEPTAASVGTGQIHYPALFLLNFGTAIAANGDAVAGIGSELGQYSAARQRAVLAGIDQHLGSLERQIGEGRAVIREWAQAMGVRPGKMGVG